MTKHDLRHQAVKLRGRVHAVEKRCGKLEAEMEKVIKWAKPGKPTAQWPLNVH